jgi:tetratricopeptide (TPR) repeat protein
LNNYGLALSALKRDEEATAVWERVIALASDHIEALYNCGRMRAKQERLEEALQLYDRVLALKPDHLDALIGQAAAFSALGEFRSAIASYSKGLEIDPHNVGMLNDRGTAFKELEQFNEALADYDRALAIDPENLTTLNNRGNVLLFLQRTSEALESYDRALANKPDHAQSCSNRGVALGRLGDYDQAFTCFNRALAIDPNLSQAWVNRGAALIALNRLPEAIAAFEAALGIEPDGVGASWNRSLAQLALGDMRQGWVGYEYRWRRPEFIKHKRVFPVPLWLGASALHGRTILLHAEQGLGDTIQFVRYVPLIARRGAEVILEVQPCLKPLLTSIEGATAVIACGRPLPTFDVYCPLLSLPLALKTEQATIPAEIPYIHPRADRVERWRERLQATQSPRIGVAWAGSSGHSNNHNRSISLEQLFTIFGGPGLSFVSLQKEVSDTERSALDSAGVIDLGAELGDFADTAAVISLLDLVISVDTSVAHLAGAMGQAVWTLLPFAADFRWLLDREDSPWYPTMRLFRQPQIRDWDTVLRRVRSELDRLFS